MTAHDSKSSKNTSPARIRRVLKKCRHARHARHARPKDDHETEHHGAIRRRQLGRGHDHCGRPGAVSRGRFDGAVGGPDPIQGGDTSRRRSRTALRGSRQHGSMIEIVRAEKRAGDFSGIVPKIRRSGPTWSTEPAPNSPARPLPLFARRYQRPEGQEYHPLKDSQGAIESTQL